MLRSTLPAHYHEKEHTLDVFLSRRFGGELRELPDKSKTCLDPMLCDTKMLDVLAKKLTTDFWSDALEEDEKRILLQKTIALKRTKGTIYGLKQIFSSLGMDVDVEEWYDYAGDPFHFNIELSTGDKEITQYLVQLLEKMIGEYKNTRSTLDEIIVSYLSRNGFVFGLGSVGESIAQAKPTDGYSALAEHTVSMGTGTVCEAIAYATNKH